MLPLMTTGGTAARRRTDIPSLNGVRAVSILLVFVGHSERLPAYIRPSLGVTIFFFLSGYLITTLLRKEADKYGTISFRKFYARRILRIWPPLYIAIALGLLVTLTGIVPGDLSVPGITTAVLQVSNYWQAFGGEGIPKAMRVLWSLGVEEHFYLLFPLLYVGLRRWLPGRMQHGAVLASICLAILGWRAVLAYGFGVDYFNRLYMGTDTRADSILWGCVLAIVANPALDAVRGNRHLWTWVGIPVGVVGLYVTQKMPDVTQPLVLTVQALLLWVILTAVVVDPDSWVGRVLNWRPVVFLGVMSYAFYLVHRYFILWADEHLADVNRWAVAALTFAASLLAAYLVHLAVEKPLEPLRKRLSRRATADPFGSR
jgi:peptidoglycan/LPS O-acetylase OafA/YrhL